MSTGTGNSSNDSALGVAWWNRLTDQQRQHWMTRAGNTGIAADAWEAFKRGGAESLTGDHEETRSSVDVLDLETEQGVADFKATIARLTPGTEEFTEDEARMQRLQAILDRLQVRTVWHRLVERTSRSHAPPKTPSIEEIPSIDGISTRSVADRGQIARRGVLGAIAALVPMTAAVALPRALAPAADPPQRENPRLIRLGDQLSAIEAQLAAAVTALEEARKVALANWPAPPAEIVWDRQRDVPTWCGVMEDRDLDDRTVYANGENRPARKVADPYQLDCYVRAADGRTRAAKDARRALALARDYEAARETVLTGSGYAAARDAVRTGEYRLERVAELIHKNKHRTAEGLAIKARALIAITTAPGVDHQTAFRHKLLHADTLARGILDLGTSAGAAARREGSAS